MNSGIVKIAKCLDTNFNILFRLDTNALAYFQATIKCNSKIDIKLSLVKEKKC